MADATVWLLPEIPRGYPAHEGSTPGTDNPYPSRLPETLPTAPRTGERLDNDLSKERTRRLAER